MAVNQSLYVTEVAGSQDVANNTSKIRIQWISEQTGESYNEYTRTAYYYISVNGGSETARSVEYNLPQSTRKTIVDTTFTVSHDDLGACSVSVRTWMDTRISAGVVELKKTLQVTTIPRASSIASAASVTLGDYCNVQWYPKASSFRYKIKFSLGSWSATTGVIHPNGTALYTYTGFKIPLAEVATLITSKRTESMRATLYTYSDSAATNQIGDASYKDFSVTVPDTSETKPTISLALSPVHSLPAAFNGLYIQSKSRVKGTVTAAGKYGASISSKSWTMSGKTYNSDGTSDYFSNYGTVKVTAQATDSRGIGNSTESEITVLPYADPKIQNVSVNRCTSDGTASDSGTYLRISAKRVYSPVEVSGSKKNLCEIRYRYKTEGGSSWSSWTTILSRTASGDTVTTGALAGSISADSSYSVEVGVIDDVGGTSSTTVPISTQAVYMYKKAGGKALGFGKVPEIDGLDVGWKAKFRKAAEFDSGVSISGNATISGNVVRRGIEYVSLAEMVNGGQEGYIKVAQIVVSRGYADGPLVFTISHRWQYEPYQVQLRFADVGGMDPTLSNFSRTPSHPGETHAYIVKSATSTWDLWVQKIGDWDDICIMDVRYTKDPRCFAITYPNTFSSVLPDGATEAVTYLNATRLNGLQVSNYDGIPTVSGGVMEIGRYIDFHTTAGGTEDYTHRLESGADTTLHLWGGSRYLDAYIDWSNVKNVNIGHKQIYSGSTSGAINFDRSAYQFVLVEGKVASNDSKSSVMCFSNGLHLFSDESAWYAFNLTDSGISARTGGSGAITNVVGIKSLSL